MGDFVYAKNPNTGNGMHSITFIRKDGGSFNTWDDWHMAPKSRPFVPAPQVKTEYVDVPGADGALDYTEVLTGRPRYANRTGQWDFIIDNGYKDWPVLYSEILSILHGKYFDKIILDDDPEYKWKGRLSITGQFANKDYSSVTISFNLDPYKYPVNNTRISNWKWSSLFGNDIVYGGFSIRGSKLHNVVNNTGGSIIANINSTSQIKVFRIADVNGGFDYEGDFYRIIANDFNVAMFSYIQLLPGDNEYELLDGDNYLFFVGNGSVKITYERGGVL